MRDFKDLEASLSSLSQLARGGQKAVYSAIHPKHGNVVVKLFFTADARSQREIDISAGLKNATQALNWLNAAKPTLQFEEAE